MSANTIIIIGAGEAGSAAAIGLREGGWTGSLILANAERHRPYERPPLSKAVLTGEGEQSPSALIAHGHRFEELGVELLSNVIVQSIDRNRRAVTMADGKEIAYDRLLVAVGAIPRRLNVEGGEHALVLRTFDDSIALRAHLSAGKRLTVIGAGFIGLELAASARSLGVDVTVLEAAPRVLMRGVPAAIAELIATRHRSAGVDIRVGTSLERIEKRASDFLVHVAGGEPVRADAVVAGVGAAPNVGLAQQAGLELDNGIAVNERLATSDPDIFAAGDCCSFPHVLYGGRRVRLEAWRNAQHQGEAVARSMLGAGEAFAKVPWFWTDQYDLHFQMAGLALGASSVVTRQIADDAMLMFHLADDGRLLAASGIGPIGRVAKEVRIGEMLIERGARIAPSSLASPDVRLKSLLAA